jgi:hypothetical protein
MDAAKHAEHSSSKLTKRRESIGEGRDLGIKNSFAEPLVIAAALVREGVELPPEAHLRTPYTVRSASRMVHHKAAA